MFMAISGNPSTKVMIASAFVYLINTIRLSNQPRVKLLNVLYCYSG